MAAPLLSLPEWIGLAENVTEAVELDLRSNVTASPEHHWRPVLVRVHLWETHLADIGGPDEHPTRDRLDELRETIALGLSPAFRAEIDAALASLGCWVP